jgi:hypothetical protein
MSEKLKTHKFARKPFYVDSVRVSEENIDRVAEWCGGEVQTDEEGKHIKVKVHRPLTDRQTKAYIGDWVLFAGTGFKVYTPKAFDKSFEKVKTLTKAQADEAGITVPHEKRQPKKPVPTEPKKVETPNESALAEMGPHYIPSEDVVIEPIKKKDEVDELFNEVMNMKN